MPKKIGVSKSEMLQMREQGLSNKDIAALLEISKATVQRYIGSQGGRMVSLAAFNERKPDQAGIPVCEQNPTPKAVDSLEMVYEVVKSADGSFRAEVDYESKCVSVLDYTIEFGLLPELATFVIGLASRINNHLSGDPDGK